MGLEGEDKIVRLGDLLGIAGLSLLALVMVAAVPMVASFVVDRTTGIATAVSTAGFVVVVWYGVALRRRATRLMSPAARRAVVPHRTPPHTVC